MCDLRSSSECHIKFDIQGDIKAISILIIMSLSR
jgi:hypothetical protein